MNIRIDRRRSFSPSRLLSGVIVAAASISLASCGGGGTSDGEGDGSGGNGSATAKKPGSGEATLRSPFPADDMPVVIDAGNAEAPPLDVVPPVLDFGFIAPNQDATGSVKLVNQGEEPLLVLAVEPSCKCTTLSELAGTVIEPGSAVELEAVLEGAPNPSVKTASIKVLVDGYAVVKTIDLRAEIALPIRAVPPHINAVRGQNRQGRIVVQSNDGRPFSICSVHGQAPRYLGFDPSTEAPTSQYVLLYDLDTIPEPFPRYLVIETDQADVPIVDVYLRHETTLPRVNRSLQMSGGYRFPLGRVVAGESGTIEIPFKSLSRPLASIHSRATGRGTARLLSTRDEETTDGIITHALVEVSPAEGHRGVLYLPLEAMDELGQVAPFDVFGVVVEDADTCAGPVADSSAAEIAPTG